ncbi:hypothetical protein TNCV_1929471 [Trichonephila clavipes]|nr:hypothetical protein TNCV_1929471 [Trichonephila clavipes]
MTSLPVPTDDIISRVFVESSALEQVVAIHSSMTAEWEVLDSHPKCHVASHSKGLESFEISFTGLYRHIVALESESRLVCITSDISSMPTSSFNGVVPRSHCVVSRHIERLTTGMLPKHSVRSQHHQLFPVDTPRLFPWPKNQKETECVYYMWILKKNRVDYKFVDNSQKAKVALRPAYLRKSIDSKKILSMALRGFQLAPLSNAGVNLYRQKMLI